MLGERHLQLASAAKLHVANCDIKLVNSLAVKVLRIVVTPSSERNGVLVDLYCSDRKPLDEHTWYGGEVPDVAGEHR